MKFRDAMQKIKESWAHELKTQSPAHIFQQAVKTLIWFPVLLIVLLCDGVYRLARTGYRYARHYFFLALHDLRVATGLYTNERPQIKRTKHGPKKR